MNKNEDLIETLEGCYDFLIAEWERVRFSRAWGMRHRVDTITHLLEQVSRNLANEKLKPVAQFTEDERGA